MLSGLAGCCLASGDARANTARAIFPFMQRPFPETPVT